MNLHTRGPKEVIKAEMQVGVECTNHLIDENPKQAQGTSKVTICPLNKKEEELSSRAV